MLDANQYLGKRLVERYHIVKEIGRGASSIVFYAEDMMTKTEDGTPMPVALKILDKDSNEYKLNSKSFYTETRAVVGMPTNPHIVAVQDVSYDCDKDVHFIVMEYVKGTTLRRYMHGHGSFSAREIISIALQVLYALRSAHEANVVHRDVKPQNILVQNDKEAGEGVALPGGKGMPYIKLADFGIARLPGEDLFAMGDRGVGTVHYISPEQAGGGTIDARSDIYSLGVVMYELATGHVPFDAENPTAVITKHQTSAPMHVRMLNPSIPLALDQIIFTAMQKDPRKRYKDACAMAKRLEDALHEIDGAAAKAVNAFVAQVPPAYKASRTRTKAPKAPKTPKAPKAPKHPREKGSGKKAATVFGGIAGALAAIALVVAAVIYLPQWIDFGGSDTVTVPRLEGEVYDAAKDYGLGITVKVSDYAHSEEFPEGTIISQTPAANVQVPNTVTVEVVVSLGPEPVEVSLPETQRVSFEKAKNYLISLKHSDPNKVFTVKDTPVVAQYDAAKGAVGTVIGMQYEDGTTIDMENGSVKKYATVVLVVNGTGVYFSIPTAERYDSNATVLEWYLSYNKAKAYVEREYAGKILVSGYVDAYSFDEEHGTDFYNKKGYTYSAVGAVNAVTGEVIDIDGSSVVIDEGQVVLITLILKTQ